MKLAREMGIQVASRAETLAAICASRRLIAVSGTHGKTTTTTLLALVLVEGGLHPSFLIGGDVNEIGTNAVWDKGNWLVVEADESDGTFLALDPEIAVLTSIEPDHLDYYGGFDKLVAAFDEYCDKASGGVVASADDAIAAEVGRRHGAELVGISGDADVRIEKLHVGREGVSFDLVRSDKLLGRLALPVSGAKLASNAAIAAVTALRVGVPIEAAAARLRPIRRSCAQVRASRRGGGSSLRRRLRAPPDGGARRARGRPLEYDRARRLCVPAPPVLAHGCRVEPVRRRLRRRRRGRDHRRLRRPGNSLFPA